MCLKSRLKSGKNVRKLEIRATWMNFSMKILFLLSYFIYFFNFEYLFLILVFSNPLDSV
jgi:hypothetical protein